MKKLLIIFGLILSVQILSSQALYRIYPIDKVTATDTILYLQKSFENLDTSTTDKTATTPAIAAERLTAWLTEAQNNKNKWWALYVRDSLYEDSVQSLIDTYFP